MLLSEVLGFCTLLLYSGRVWVLFSNRKGVRSRESSYKVYFKFLIKKDSP